MIKHMAPLLLGVAFAADSSAACESLRSLSDGTRDIRAAEAVPAGTHELSGPGPGQTVELPAHCRVNAMLRPSEESEIEIEVWMPADGWNGNFQAVGNGGWAGSINFSGLAGALREGYATASTDTGHNDPSGRFAIGSPERLIDFAYRAVHEMTVTAKELVENYYGRDPELSYWNACSTGGRQGLMAAQRYPDDFDAILAGAPAYHQSHQHAWNLSVVSSVVNNPESALPPEKLELVHRAVLEACDGNSGVRDGFLNNPMTCDFDPATLLCEGEDQDDCLTAAQVETIERVTSPAMTSDGEPIFAGRAFGSELGWAAITPNAGQTLGTALPTYRVALEDPDPDWRAFDLDRDLPVMERNVGSVVDAIDADLSEFKARGGKLLLWHGWNDTAISPENTINYYNRVLDTMGEDQDDWVRLFMAPGVGHCAGGVGPDRVNWMAVLERWREADEAPERITAIRVRDNQVDMTRPLCPYPQVARYTGVGSVNDAGNFVCAADDER